MKPLSRNKVRKGSSAKAFSYGARKAKAPNVRLAPMRGGWRL